MKEKKGYDTLEQLLKPRQIFTVNSSDVEYIENEINRFFNSVTQVLGYDDKAKEELVKRKSFVLRNQEDGTETDDRITLLIARNTVVASVLVSKDKPNYVKVAGASYLNKEMIRGIGERVSK